VEEVVVSAFGDVADCTHHPCELRGELREGSAGASNGSAGLLLDQRVHARTTRLRAHRRHRATASDAMYSSSSAASYTNLRPIRFANGKCPRCCSRSTHDSGARSGCATSARESRTRPAGWPRAWIAAWRSAIPRRIVASASSIRASPLPVVALRMGLGLIPEGGSGQPQVVPGDLLPPSHPGQG